MVGVKLESTEICGIKPTLRNFLGIISYDWTASNGYPNFEDWLGS